MLKERKFIRKAEYPGGNLALKKFLDNNIRYPKLALERKIEGRVFLKYEVSNIGGVQNIEVIKGLGYGCDEEAIRLVSLLKYGGLNNKGCKVNTKFKLSIRFKIPAKNKIQINYVYKPKT